MEYLTKKLNSGIVRCDVFSDTFKTNCISVSFFWQLDEEYASQIALIASVLKRGNTVFGQMNEISAFLDLNYGASFDITTSKIGELQELNLTATYIDDKYAISGESISENMVRLICAALFSPITENGVFKNSFVLQEKQNLKDKIEAVVNDKQTYSFEKCKKAMFQNEKYGTYELGSIEKINEITASSLYAFYKTLLEKATLFISYGGVRKDTDTLLAPLVDALSGKLRSSFETEQINTVEKVKEITEKMNVVQSKLNLGFRLGAAAADDLFALKMFNVMFGASPTSKLFMNVRERLSLCYYCSGVVDSLKNVMFVYSGVETNNAETAKKEILYQLSLMKKGEFTDEEICNAKAYLTDSFRQVGDSAAASLSVALSAVLHGHNLSAKEQLAEIEKVTKERIIAVAQDIELDTVYLLQGIGGDKSAN